MRSSIPGVLGDVAQHARQNDDDQEGGTGGFDSTSRNDESKHNHKRDQAACHQQKYTRDDTKRNEQCRVVSAAVTALIRQIGTVNETIADIMRVNIIKAS